MPCKHGISLDLTDLRGVRAVAIGKQDVRNAELMLIRAGTA